MNVTIENAVQKFGGSEILNHFSLELPERGLACLLGPSGCGKTTLLNAVAGICRLQSGKILGTERLKISCVFQEDRLLPWYSAWENISFALCGEKRRLRGRAEEWLRLVGLDGEGEKLPSQMSGGMKRRVAIARALAYGGDFYLLDEPFQRLDEKTRRMVLKLVKEKIGGAPGLLVTHDQTEAFELSKVVYIVEGPPLKIGKIIPVTGG